MTLSRLNWPTWAKSYGTFINQGEVEAVLNLPTGKVYSHVPRLVSTTEADLISRGFNYFFDVAGGSIDPARRVVLYGAVDIRNWAFAHLGGKVAAQWTQAEVVQFINSLYPYGITTDSLDEGYDLYADYTFPTGSQTRAWANEALAALAKTVTPNAILIASYAAKYLEGQDVFFSGSNPINPNTAAARNALGSQAAARAGIDFYTKGVSSTARANVTIYPGSGLRNVNGNWSNYIIPYEFLRLRKASGPGLEPLGFTWCSIEGGGYTGSYAWRHELPTGTLYQADEAFWSFNKCYWMTASSLLFGGGQILWDRPDRFLTDPSKPNVNLNSGDDLRNFKDLWVPKNGSPAPASSSPRYFPLRSQSHNDAHLSAAVEYGQLAQAAGTNFQFARYRVKRGTAYGAWNEVPSDIPDAALLEAGQQFRGICTAAVTGNDVAVVFQDPSNTIQGERVQVDLGSGRFVDFDCYGQEPVRIRGSINANATQTLNR